MGNGLGRVNNAAAADGDEKIDLLAAGKLDAFVDKAALGVGLHAAELDAVKTGGIDGRLDAVKQSGSFRGLAAIDDEHAAAAEFGDVFAGVILAVAPEHKICRAVKVK